MPDPGDVAFFDDTYDRNRNGRIDDALLEAALPGRDAWCLVCGPAGFVGAVAASLEGLGVPPERIVVER